MFDQVNETSKMITEMGIMVTISAFFLIGTVVLFFFTLKSMKKDREEAKKLNDHLIAYITNKVDELIKATNSQNSTLNKIAEGLEPETIRRIEAISEPMFDLAVERVVQMLRRVRLENGIADHEKTHKKIMMLVSNLHNKRNSRFESFSFRGKSLNQYCNPEWINWVSDVVENELYAKEQNENRTYTNIKAIYETIKTDFYQRLKA